MICNRQADVFIIPVIKFIINLFKISKYSFIFTLDMKSKTKVHNGFNLQVLRGKQKNTFLNNFLFIFFVLQKNISY